MNPFPVNRVFLTPLQLLKCLGDVTDAHQKRIARSTLNWSLPTNGVPNTQELHEHVVKEYVEDKSLCLLSLFRLNLLQNTKCDEKRNLMQNLLEEDFLHNRPLLNTDMKAAYAKLLSAAVRRKDFKDNWQPGQE